MKRNGSNFDCSRDLATKGLRRFQTSGLFLSFLLLTAVVVAAEGKTARASEDKASGLDLSYRNLSVSPGDDFESYASGTWWRKTTIPPDQIETGPYQVVADRTEERIHRILEECAQKPANPTSKKIGDLYGGFMDEKRIEGIGAVPLEREVGAIRRLKDKEAVAERMGESQRNYGKGFFLLKVRVDSKDPTQHIIRVDQSGLAMEDREMYLSDEFKSLRTAYRDYARRTFGLIHWPEPEKSADEILAMETRIAEVSWSQSESNDRVKMYNPMTVVELEGFAPSFPWRAYLRGAGLESLERLTAGQKSALPKIADVFRDASLETLKAWMALQVSDESAPYLPRSFVENRFAFRGKAEQGLEHEQPRWKRGVALLNVAIDQAVGREYVGRYFPPETKAKMEALVANLKDAMFARIGKLTWMQPETKAAALEKLKRLRVLVGYPEKWRDYSGLTIERKDVYGSVRTAKAFEWAWQIGRLNQPVDRNEFWQAPQTVDAYSDLSRIHIGFPAAVLQSPFVNFDADPAATYGAIGTVIGHEITHQFDSQGRKYDATGALRDWWSAQDAAHFEEAAARLVAQVDAYEPFPGIHLNGKLTLSENIADLGGLLIALDAYHESLHGHPAPVIDGTTGDQRVFLGMETFFRTKMREEVDKQQAASGVHALPRFRVIGAMRNIDAWYDAFEVRPGARYYLAPEDRVRIW